MQGGSSSYIPSAFAWFDWDIVVVVRQSRVGSHTLFSTIGRLWFSQPQQQAPNNNYTAPGSRKRRGGGGQDLERGGGPRKEGVWKNSPFSINPPLGLPWVPLGFFFCPAGGVFGGFGGFSLGFWLLSWASWVSGLWPLASLLASGSAGFCLPFLAPHSNADRNLCN